MSTNDALPGRLPPGWKLETIGEVCDANGGEVQTGPFGSQLHAADYVEDGVPSVMPKDMHGVRISTETIARVPEADAARLSVHRLRAGDIVYARRGDIGRRALVTSAEEGWLCGTGCLRIRLNAPGILPEYVLAYLGHPALQRWVEDRAQGATMLNLNTGILRAVPLRIPPLPEQRRIADILDKADAIRRKRKEAIALTEELSRSAFLEMFGDPVTNPKGWPVRAFGDLLSMPLRNGLSPASGGLHAADVLTLSAITRGAWDPSAVKPGVFAVEPWEDVRVDERDFLVCRGNGNPSLVGAGVFPLTSDDDVVFPDTMIAARVDRTVLMREYLTALWRTPFVRRQIEASARTTNGTFKVNQTAVENVVVLVPPLAVQREFESLAITARRLRERYASAACDNLFRALVYRAFRGELPS